MGFKLALHRCLSLLLALGVALCMVLSAVPLCAFASQQDQGQQQSGKVVRIGLFEDIYHKVDANGQLYGYGYEYLQKIVSYTGWTLEYVQADWSTCFDKLENGEIDILNGISWTAEREQDMLFSSLPMAQERYFIYADSRNMKIDPADVGSIDGKTVGVMEGAAPEDVLCKWEEENGLSAAHIKISTAQDVIKKLDKGKMDCFVSIEETWDQDYVTPLMYIGSSDVYFALAKDRQDLKKELDYAMERIIDSNPFYNDELYERFLSTSKTVALTDAEQSWLQGHGTIRIGYIDGDVNIGSLDKKTGKLSGIITDYMQYARDCLGAGAIEFEAHGYDNMEQELEALAAGEIDMIFKMPYSPRYVELYNLSLSDNVLDIPYSAVSKPGHFDQNGEVSVAIPAENWVKRWYVEYCYPSWRIVECSSADEAESMMRSGQVDCFLSRTGTSRVYAKDSECQVNMLVSDISTSFAVAREDTVLLSILNKTIEAMPADMLSDALVAYDNETDNVTLFEFVRDNLAEVIFAVLGIALVIAVISLALRRSKAAERELTAAKLDADKANAAKTDFLRRMSHDIRTPINGIRGMVQIANSNMDDRDKLEDCRDKIWKATDHLLSLVNDVLDMNKLESGSFTLRRDPFELSQIVDEIHTVIEPQAAECGVRIEAWDMSAIEHDRLVGTPVYIKRILMNFAGNAVKYNRPGGIISLIGREVSFDGKTACLEFICEDTGIGMSEEFLQHAFEPFTQEGQPQARTTYNGSGLGLAISKSLVELLGGSLDLRSVLGEGTKVVFKIPVEVDDEEDYNLNVCDCSDALFDGVRALLVEDNEINAEIATFMLEQHGLEVTWVENGKLAVEELAANPASYDVVFMDVMMPVMDGHAATRKIRSELGLDIPVFAMTANAFIDDAQLSRDAGMDEHLTKPLREEEIVRALSKHVGR